MTVSQIGHNLQSQSNVIMDYQETDWNWSFIYLSQGVFHYDNINLSFFTFIPV